MFKMELHPDSVGGSSSPAEETSDDNAKSDLPLPSCGLPGDVESPALEEGLNDAKRNPVQPQNRTWSPTVSEGEQDRKVHRPVRRGMSWTAPKSTAAGWSKNTSQGEQTPLVVSELPWKDGSSGQNSTGDGGSQEPEWKLVQAKPVVVARANKQGRKTNLSRSASLSEKELKEARDRSQIIAAQLTVPTNTNSRGVQLFNRRKQRVNAFTLVSFGKGIQQESLGKEQQGPVGQNTVTWEEKCTESKNLELNCSDNNSKFSWCSGQRKHTGNNIMEEQVENIQEVDNVVTSLKTSEFLPEDEIDEELAGEFFPEDSTSNKGEPPNEIFNNSADKPADVMVVAEVNGLCNASITKAGENGCSSTHNSVEVTFPLSKQPPAIINRTARPFGSPAMVCSPEARSPVMDLPSPPSFSAPPQPAFSNPPPVSRVISPSPYVPQCTANADTRHTYVPQYSNESKQQVHFKTGILDEGKARRAARKSMFTFQEKPKVAPNPELLSLVQGVDEKKKQKPPGEHTHDEELLALGAEASNFQTKANSEETKVPEWSTCLKSSGVRVRAESKPAQGLTNVAGKGAELFAKRQSRMEKYVVEAPSAVGRCPSPTMSLPPSWTFPSNMPGRIKAIASSSNVGVQPSRTSKAIPASGYRNEESSVMENGCTKKEMDIAKHQPYQLNSSLFIFNPTKDPMRSLPKAAPPPKPMVPDKAYSRQTSLPMSPPSPSPLFNCPAPFRATKALSPQVLSRPLNGVGSVDFRSSHGAPPEPEVARIMSPASPLSPRPGVQAPRPSFSAKKAGIEPQIRRDSLPIATTWTPTQPRRFSTPEGPINVVKAHSAMEVQMTTRSPYPSAGSSPLSPPWEGKCQSPTSQDIKTNHRLLAKNIINAARRKNSPSPGGLNVRGSSVSPVSSYITHGHQPLSPSSFQCRALANQSPTFMSPPPTPTRMIRSPVRLYTTRSLTDSDASIESEDSGLRSPSSGTKSPSIRSHNTCPRGWNGSLRIKRGSIPADL
ncbi:synaptopodin [Amia ocellicauda]|uniref:synaptopodin n=1 Tax=Amia ocellicauda TaxID=2972642 RepID=UPI003464D41F